MKRIEKAIQREGLELYRPSFIHTVSVVTDEILVKETKSMLEFVGLKGYTPYVKFSITEDGVAGNISSANNTFERTVHINVSNNYVTKWKCCIAILAHEICHKLLAVNGLYDYDINTNETLVDLSTIYVGFGNLILEGYVSESKNQIIGYLNINNYKVAHQIICVVYGKEKVSSTGLQDVDVLIDEALALWENAESEYKLMKDCFCENERQISEFHRNLILLEQIIKQCKLDMIHEFAKYDNVFFKTLNEKEGYYNNKLTVFSILYELIAKESYPIHKKNQFIFELNKIVNNAIYDLFIQYQSKKTLEFKYDFECPHCGVTLKNNNKVINRNTILRCSKCGCHYYYYGEMWNCSRRQKELNEAKLRENRRFEEKVEEKVNKKAEQYRKDKEQIKKQTELKLENIRQKAETEIENIRKYEHDKYKNIVFKRTPWYLRWIVKKYF
ncbi:MAG: hypothetical protein J1E57_00295 [Prevotella sp.]|nr:hypothetical protein [Prevotella sp.]